MDKEAADIRRSGILGGYVRDADGLTAFTTDMRAVSRGVGTPIVQDEIGEVWISTVFLAFDHAHVGLGAPVLWETMVFGGVNNDYQERYTSEKDALAGHALAVAAVRDGLKIG